MSGKMKLLVALCLLVLVLVPSFALAKISNRAIVNGTIYADFMDAVKAANGTSYPVEIYGTMTVSGASPTTPM